MNIITIDADKAAGEIKKTILRDCTVPVPESAEDMAEEIRQIWKSYSSDCEVVYNADYAVRDKEIAALIQAYVEAQVADLKAKIEDFKKRCADLKAENENLKKYCAIYK